MQKRVFVRAPLVEHIFNHENYGFKKAELPHHSEGDTRNSSLFASVQNQFPEYAEDYMSATMEIDHPDTVRLIAYFDKNYGFFRIKENGHYRWGAYKVHVPPLSPRAAGPSRVKWGDLIENSVSVEKIFMSYNDGHLPPPINIGH